MRNEDINKILAVVAAFTFLAVMIFTPSANAAMVHVESEKVVYFFGDFQSGEDVAALTEALDGKEDVTVRFHSGGGSVAVGVAIADVIAKHGASTEVVKDGYCASICAYAWLAGKSRTVSEGSYLAVHNVYQNMGAIANMSPIEYQHQSMKTIGILMYRAEKGGYGAPIIYWANLLATPYDKMYAFTREELELIER